jgi:hypothetical protein
LIRESVWEGKSTLPKTKKGYRKVVLTDEQMKVLREYKERNYPDAPPDAWVLPGKRGRPVDLGHMMSKYIKPLASKAGIPGNSLARPSALEQLTHDERGCGHYDSQGPPGTHAGPCEHALFARGDQSQLAASQVVWQKLKEAESKRNQTPTSA